MEIVIKENTKRLEYLEGIIEKGLQSFYEVGKALLEIKDNQLYEKVRGVANFKTYCKERWGLSRAHADRLMVSSTVVDNLSPRGDIIPQSERHVRPLTSLPPEKQVEVWQEAVETAPDGKITAAHVQAVVDKDRDVVPEDSNRLSDIKSIWHTLNADEKRKFVKWVKEYFGKYIK